MILKPSKPKTSKLFGTRRRALHYLLSTGGALLGLGLARQSRFVAPAVAQKPRVLKMVTTWPKNFPGLGTAPENIARNVAAMSDGQLRIKIFAAGELVGAFEAFDAVSTGVAEMYNGAEYYWQGKSPGFNFFTSVPFGMTAQEISAWVQFGGGQALWDELSAKFNLRAFQSANTGVQMGGWFNKEIRSVEDFRGLKIRMPGLGGEVLRRLGAIAVALPGGEIFPAMRSGAIDASEWVGPWNDQAFGFYQAARYYYWPGFHEPGAALATGINLDVWRDLPSTHQKILAVACQAEVERSLAEFNYKNAIALKGLITTHNVQLRRFPPDVLIALRRYSMEVLESISQTDDLTGRIYESFQKSLTTIADWTHISEAAYTALRNDSPC